MLSFVWSAKYPFLAGAGGSENYTAGHVRELMRRGIPTRILTIGHGEADGRQDFPDITFQSIKYKEELSELDDTLVFVTYPLAIPTRRKAFAVLHCPPPAFARGDHQYDPRSFKGKRLITTSKFAAGLWRRYLRAKVGHMPTVYPFAEPPFAAVERPPKKRQDVTRILFAGRLTPDKGIYTLLTSLHMEAMQDLRYKLTVTTACSHADEAKLILPMVQAHPLINLVEARRTPEAMAKLMAEHDVVVMPSTNIFWQEMFGIVSVEAQHAGCRVVASRAGGIPETNVGGVVLVRPDDPNALAKGIARAAALGPLTAAERAFASTRFNVRESVDALLKAMRYGSPAQKPPLRKRASLGRHLQVQLDLSEGRSKA